MTDQSPPSPSLLRERAERLLQSASDGAADPLPDNDFRQIIHELQVHQIELELQNEDLRATQNALEESRGRYMRLYHNAPVGYVVLNSAGIVNEVNGAFAEMTCRDRAQVLGRPFGDFLHPMDRSIFFARSKALFKNPVDKYLELRLQAADRAARTVSLRASHCHSAKQNIFPPQSELLLTVTDITDRVRAERALRESELFARSTVDALAANIAILDAAGTIIAINRAWREFARDNQANEHTVCEGTNYLALCHAVQGKEAEAARTFAAGIVAVINGDKDIHVQEYACHSPQENRWFIGRVTRFPGDRDRRVVVAHENITERKQLELQNLRLQRQVNQLEKEDSLGRMAGAIAHHFNNLLFVILGNLELALENAAEGTLLRQTLVQAQEGAAKAAKISGKMLTYLGLNAKGKTTVDLSALCRQSLPLLTLKKPAGTILHSTFPAFGPLFEADPNQIQELLALLVDNAFEACHDQACDIHLRIDTIPADKITARHRFPLAWNPRASTYARLSVADTGTGIAEEHLEKIFDPFFSNKFLGRGLGLPLVLGILRSHQGCVTATSQEGKGSTFNIHFPLPDRASSPAADAMPRT
jgi:PAS domain S-box-containing protein